MLLLNECVGSDEDWKTLEADFSVKEKKTIVLKYTYHYFIRFQEMIFDIIESLKL